MSNLNELQFHHHMPGEGEKTHQITATDAQQNVVGWMSWARKGGSGIRQGEILALRVRPDMRRQGIATAMYGRSQNFDVGARHSSSRSPEGTAFAKSTGASVPKLKSPIPSESHLDIPADSLMQMGDLDRRAKRIP